MCKEENLDSRVGLSDADALELSIDSDGYGSGGVDLLAADSVGGVALGKLWCIAPRGLLFGVRIGGVCGLCIRRQKIFKGLEFTGGETVVGEVLLPSLVRNGSFGTKLYEDFGS